MTIYVPGKVTLAKEFTWNESIWNPSMLSTALWLDAADASTITESGGVVSQWDDKSGNDRHAVQATSANKPTTGTRSLNGLNVLDFDGLDDFLETGLAPAINRTIAVVVAYDTVNSLIIPFGARQDLEERSYIGVNFGESRFAAGDKFPNGNIDMFVNTGYIQIGMHSDSLTMTHYLNGTQDQNDTFNGPIGSGQNYYVGTLNDRGSPLANAVFNGRFCEAVAFDYEIDAYVRQKLEGYLAHKWGLTANLPSGHPYKLVGPTP